MKDQKQGPKERMDFEAAVLREIETTTTKKRKETSGRKKKRKVLAANGFWALGGLREVEGGGPEERKLVVQQGKKKKSKLEVEYIRFRNKQERAKSCIGKRRGKGGAFFQQEKLPAGR